MNKNNLYNFNIANFNNQSIGIELKEGLSGKGLTYNGLEIHDSYDPLAQSQNIISKALKSISGQPDACLMFGLGLGWHIKVLRELYPKLNIMVYEPTEAFKSTYLKHKVTDENFDLYYNWNDFMAALAQKIVYGNFKNPFIFEMEPYKQLWPEAGGLFKIKTKEEIMRKVVIEQTRSNHQEQAIDNLIANMPFILKLPDISYLKFSNISTPAFVVGSGASLEVNGDLLKKVKNKALIIAASSAVKPLLAKGVSPDIVIVLETSDTSHYLTLNSKELDTLNQKCLLALSASCHPAHFKAVVFNKAIFYLTQGEAQMFGQGLFLPQGGNAGTAGFSLAYLMGCRKIILVGQDQAYLDGRLHANGIEDKPEDKQAELIQIPGIDNKQVLTNSAFLASRNWFSESANTINKKENPPKLYNASAFGASIEGFEEKKLDKILEELESNIQIPDLKKYLLKLPKADVKAVKKDIEQLLNLLSSINKLSAIDSSQAESEFQNLMTLSPFLNDLAIGNETPINNLKKTKSILQQLRDNI